jgi:hypothetical protein
MKTKLQAEKDVVWPIRMKRSLKEQFKLFCDSNGYSMNKRIRILMELDMKSISK